MERVIELRRAEQFRRSGQVDDALDVLRTLFSSDPGDDDVQRRLVSLLVDSGRKDAAISLLVKVQERLAEEGDLLGAIAAALKVLELDPSFENPLAYVAKVRLESLEDDYKRRSVGAIPVRQSLDQIPFLEDLRPEELSSVASQMKRHEVPEGAFVFREGDPGESLFFVNRGLIEVQSSASKLGLVKAGQCFGEFSFLTRARRAATVRAVEPSELLELSAETLKQLAEKHPRLRDVLFETYRERALSNVLSQSPLFEMLPLRDRERLAPRFKRVKLSAGEPVFREGESSSALYLIKEGSLEVQATLRGETLSLATLRPHQFFGEVSFLTGVPRTATVHACEESELLKIEEEELKELIRHHPFMKDVLTRYHLDRVTATAETLKAFLKSERVAGILG